MELFARWLQEAIELKIPEPHAMTLSTVDQDHMPDARVLILKDIDQDGWHFASGNTSGKGLQLAKTPKAALTFYWKELGRSVRVRGSVKDLGPERGKLDFLRDLMVRGRWPSWVRKASDLNPWIF